MKITTLVVAIFGLAALFGCQQQEEPESTVDTKRPGIRKRGDRPIPKSPPGLTSLNTQNCVYRFQPFHTKLTWTAFKTEQKIGVKGSFKQISYQLKKTYGREISEILKDAKVNIITSSVTTKDKQRDNRLTQHFFQKWLNGDEINLLVKRVNMESKTLEAEISMNGVTNRIDFQIYIKDNYLRLDGKIDVLYFKLDKQLDAINKACHDLHAGRTWSDVDLTVETHFLCK